MQPAIESHSAVETIDFGLFFCSRLPQRCVCSDKIEQGRMAFAQRGVWTAECRGLSLSFSLFILLSFSHPLLDLVFEIEEGWLLSAFMVLSNPFSQQKVCMKNKERMKVLGKERGRECTSGLKEAKERKSINANLYMIRVFVF